MRNEDEMRMSMRREENSRARDCYFIALQLHFIALMIDVVPVQAFNQLALIVHIPRFFKIFKTHKFELYQKYVL